MNARMTDLIEPKSRAVAGSGAQLLITPNVHDYVADGIGAGLRYEV